jgi:hypothetical protein
VPRDFPATSAGRCLQCALQAMCLRLLSSVKGSNARTRVEAKAPAAATCSWVLDFMQCLT